MSDKDREGRQSHFWDEKMGRGGVQQPEELSGRPGSSLTSPTHRFWALLSQAGWDRGSVCGQPQLPLKVATPPTVPDLRPKEGALGAGGCRL